MRRAGLGLGGLAGVLALVLSAGCGWFAFYDSHGGHQGDIGECLPVSLGGTRADLGSLFFSLNPVQHPYQPCRPGEECLWPDVVAAKVVVLVDLPFSMFLDAATLPVFLGVDAYVQYLHFNHLLNGLSGERCSLRGNGRRPGVAPPPPGPTYARHFGPYAASPGACMAVRGEWTVFSPTGERYCIVPTPDGGNACQDTADCQGFCVVPPGPLAVVAPGTRTAGVCAARFQQDCFQYVMKGVAQPRVCVTGREGSG